MYGEDGGTVKTMRVLRTHSFDVVDYMDVAV